MGIKKVEESGNMAESTAPESMSAQLWKSPAPIRASIMLLTCWGLEMVVCWWLGFSCSSGGMEIGGDVGMVVGGFSAANMTAVVVIRRRRVRRLAIEEELGKSLVSLIASLGQSN